MRVILLSILSITLLPGGTIYSVVDLGSFGGSSAIGYKINASGVVVGWSQTAVGNQNAFISTGNSLQPLAGLSGSDAYAYGINLSGTAVGTSYVDGQPHGTVWSAGSVTDLGSGIFATGINDAGVVIGSNGHAFALANGAYRDLGLLPGGDWSGAYGINDNGAVAGYGSIGSGAFRGFVWTPSGDMAELGTLGGANSYAMAINSSGAVAGQASLADGMLHAFTAIGAMMTDLGTLGGGSSYAYGINDSGAVVGYSWLNSGANPHAFLYQNGFMYDLNSLILPCGWELLGAYGINNAGQITGEGLFQGQKRAFRLDPISSISGPNSGPTTSSPDPDTGTLAVIGAGLVFLARIRIRKG